MKTRQYGRKPASDTSVVPATNLLQTRPFHADTHTPQPQESAESLTASFDLTQVQPAPTTHPTSALGQPLQAKLTIGQPNDQYEQEADRVAHNVVQQINAPQPEAHSNALQRSAHEQIQRQGLEGEDEDLLQAKLESNVVQRGKLEEDEELQMKPDGSRCKTRHSTQQPLIQADFEAHLNRAKSGGSPLDPAFRAKVEPAMGADFSKVKIHTDSTADQLSRSIQAKAFTTGKNVFFRQGEYQPKNRTGQELITHELTHVMQQTQMKPGSGNNQDPIEIKKASEREQKVNSISSSRLLQRKKYFVGKPNTPIFDYDSNNNVLYTRKKALDLNTPVDAESTANYKGIDASKNEYKKLEKPIGRVDGVIHQDSLRDTPKHRTGVRDVLETGASFYDLGNSAYDTRAGSLDRGALRELDSRGYKVDKTGNTETSAWQDKHGSEVVSGSYETIGNILAIATTLSKWKKRDTQGKISDAIDVAKTGTSTVAAVTKIVDSGGKLDEDHRSGLGKEITISGGGRSSATSETGSYKTNQSDLAGKTTGNIADFAGLVVDVKDVFFKGKKLWEAWKERQEEGTASRGDIANAGIDLGMSIIGTIKDVVSTARNLLFTLENAWHGGLSTALPGLGIAISGLKILVSMWHVIKAFKHRKKMQSLKRDWKQQLGHTETNKLDNKKIAKLKKVYELEIQDGKGNTPKLKEKLEIIKEYELQKELQTISQKRINRQVLHITTAFTSIAGDIATLSGYGAGAGMGLKLAASGTELGAVGARTVKQWGRDRASKKGAWKITQTIFDKNKNTKAKTEKREKFANMIYDMVIALSTEADNFKDGQVPYEYPLFKRIRDYIRAAGLSWKVWLNKTSTDPQQGHEALMSALAERE